jgi:oxygen-independent coproporphyrinogen III oxidase
MQKRLELASRLPHEFTIQYPIRREYFIDNFDWRRRSESREKEVLNVQTKRERMQRVIDRQRSGRVLTMPDILDGNAVSEYGLYIHVPFCVSKCFFCNFAVDTRDDSSSLHADYVDELCADLDTRLESHNVVLGPNSRSFSLSKSHIEVSAARLASDSNGARLSNDSNDSNDARLLGIDIGGGTPTLLRIDLLERLLRSVRRWRDFAAVERPLSVESTPAIAAREPDKMKMMAEMGVDRVSIGLQSTNAETLRAVNRLEQIELAERAVDVLRRTFDRVSVDLIFGLPGQSLDAWRDDLRRVVELGVDTVTTYDCLYKGKGRAFRHRSASSAPADAPSWQHYGALYDEAYRYLTANGYSARYGSVNFSRHGDSDTGVSRYFESRLLDGLSYIGIGNYASSLHADRWWFAPFTVDEWLQNARAHNAALSVGDAYTLPPRERMAKYALASLSFGIIDAHRFERAFPGHRLLDTFARELDYAVAKHWLVASADGRSFHIAPGQFYAMPSMRSLFVTDLCIDWLSYE